MTKKELDQVTEAFEDMREKIINSIDKHIETIKRSIDVTEE